MSKATEVWRALEPAFKKGDEFAVCARKAIAAAGKGTNEASAEAEDAVADEVLRQIAPFIDPDVPPTPMSYVSRITFSCLVDEGIKRFEDYLGHPSNREGP